MGRSGVLSSGSRFPCVISYISRGCWEQRPTPEWYNLHVGAVSRHRLDSLNASNDFPQKKTVLNTNSSKFVAHNLAEQPTILGI